MKTATGFEYEIDKTRLNNMELLDAFAELEDHPEDILLMSRIVTLMFGKAVKKRLYDHVREDDGRVTVERISQEMVDIFHSSGDEIKKLSSSQG